MEDHKFNKKINARFSWTLFNSYVKLPEGILDCYLSELNTINTILYYIYV